MSIFSTSVELGSENVCVCVCLSVCLSVCPKYFGAGSRLQKWSDLAEILHTCSLDEYLGVFFLFFENFDFWDLGTSFSAKTRLKLWGSLEASKMVGFG